MFGYYNNFKTIVHSLNHPAKIWYSPEAAIQEYHEWWIHGKNMTPKIYSWYNDNEYNIDDPLDKIKLGELKLIFGV